MVFTDFNYPAKIERDEDGRHLVTFPDFGWGATDGETREEALTEARDMLRELITAAIRDGKDLPTPFHMGWRSGPMILPPIQIVLKAALYESFRESGLSRRQFARQLNIAETEVRRMLNPDHATKVAAIERALAHLGWHVSVSFGAALPDADAVDENFLAEELEENRIIRPQLATS